MNVDLYAGSDQSYLLAHNAATDLLKAGDIKAYSVSNDRGRVIYVESDQGWDPYPFYQEFDDGPAFAQPPN